LIRQSHTPHIVGVIMNQGKSINYAMVFLIGCLAISLSFSGCTSQQSKLIGKWQEIGKTETLEFFSDNRVAISEKGLTITGDWTILDDGRVKVEFPVAGITITATGKIEGDILYITEQNGVVSRYQKLTA
jgi:hypothetical protein